MESEDNERLLLATKLAIPSTYHKKIVPRPRLYSQLQAGAQRPLTLITAPAGFGKTTLIGEWLQQCERPVAWISLENSDNNLIHFWRYVIKALSSHHPAINEQIGRQFELSEPYRLETLHLETDLETLNIEALLTTLLNTLMTLPQDTILALDDYQTITEPTIHQSLQFLLEHLPYQLHLFITTRTNFPLPIARLRVQGKLTELRATDLRFTPDETAHFLTQAMGLALSTTNIAAINERTEGWAAGLQLAALALQGWDDPPTIDKLIYSFSGHQHNVLYYLTEEVLAYQPPEVQDFLLATSVLERMNADLCNAVTGQNNGQAMLEQLDAANLFLLTIDESKKCYRYYHLFSEFMRHHLQYNHPELGPDLHLRACTWYEQHGMIVEAVTHALASGSTERAANILEEHAWSLIWQLDDSLIYCWLIQLPTSLFTTRPALCYLHAWTLYARADIEGSEQALKQAESLWQEDNNNAVLNRIHNFRAYMALLREDGAETLRHAQQTLALTNDKDQQLQASAQVTLGGAYLLMGEIAQARIALKEAYSLSQKSGNIVSMQLATSYLGKVYMMQGNLHIAHQTYQQMFSEIDKIQARYRVNAHVQLAKIYREWNNITTAYEHWKQATCSIDKSAQEEFTSIESSILAAQLAWVRGEQDEVLPWLDRAEQSARRFGISYTALTEIANMRVHFLLAQGDLKAAISWSKHYKRESEVSLYEKEANALMEARLLIAQEKSKTAIPLLEEVLQTALTQGRHGNAIAILVLLTLAHHADGTTQATFQRLEQALTLAEAAGYMRTFIDEGSTMAILLNEFCSRYQRRSVGNQERISFEYIDTILSALKQDTPVSWIISHQVQDREEMQLDALSEREHTVLLLIAEGLSNQEIARTLVVTVSTVKTHLNNIYAKLHVHTRLQAVTRAYDLGLLSRVETENGRLNHLDHPAKIY
jgi:LuxR family maltose regulon positive regulatory protein